MNAWLGAQRLVDDVDRLRAMISQHAADTIQSGRDVHQHDRDLWKAVGQDAIDEARENRHE